MAANTRFKYRFCDHVLPAWLPVAMRLDGAMLLHHLGQHHPDKVNFYLDQMRTDEDHDRVVVQAYEVMEEDETQ
jgi:hypothetical protein